LREAGSDFPGCVHFGLGKTRQADRIEIRRPSGIEQALNNVRTDQALQVTEQANATPAPAK